MKAPLVLLSGLLSNKLLWRHQVDHLGDIAEIRTMAPSQDTPDRMVQAILDAAPPKFALAGHSMGGWLCLEVMRTAPSRVSKLCLLNTTAREDTEDKSTRRQTMIQTAENGQFEQLAKELIAYFVFNPLVRDDVEKMFLDVGKEAFIHQEKAMLIRSECDSILPNISCPTLVIHSAHDKIFSLEEHQELVNHIKNAKLAIVEDSGHMSPLEVPQAITTLLRFWLTYF